MTSGTQHEISLKDPLVSGQLKDSLARAEDLLSRGERFPAGVYINMRERQLLARISIRLGESDVDKQQALLEGMSFARLIRSNQIVIAYDSYVDLDNFPDLSYPHQDVDNSAPAEAIICLVIQRECGHCFISPYVRNPDGTFDKWIGDKLQDFSSLVDARSFADNVLDISTVISARSFIDANAPFSCEYPEIMVRLLTQKGHEVEVYESQNSRPVLV